MRTITIYVEDDEAYYRVQNFVERILSDLGMDRKFVWIHHDGLYPDQRGGARAVVFNASDITKAHLLALSESIGALIWKREDGIKYYMGDLYT